jgi:hypothetical protein
MQLKLFLCGSNLWEVPLKAVESVFCLIYGIYSFAAVAGFQEKIIEF